MRVWSEYITWLFQVNTQWLNSETVWIGWTGVLFNGFEVLVNNVYLSIDLNLKWRYFYFKEWRVIVVAALTKLFDLFANGALIWRLTIWIQLAGWVCAFNEAPASLLVVYDAHIEWIVAKCGIWCVRTTSPAFYGRCCKKEKQNKEKYKSNE